MAFHQNCVQLSSIPRGSWFCTVCNSTSNDSLDVSKDDNISTNLKRTRAELQGEHISSKRKKILLSDNGLEGELVVCHSNQPNMSTVKEGVVSIKL